MPNYLEVALLLVFVFVVIEALAIFALARSVGLILVRVGGEPGPLETSDGPSVGSETPVLSGYELNMRRAIQLDTHAERWLVVFVSATCAMCRQVADAAAHLDGDMRRRTVLVARGSDDQNQLFLKYAPNILLLSDSSGDLHRAFGVSQAPFGVLIEEGRVVAKGVVNHRDHLDLLLERRTTRLPDETWIPVASGEQAPGNVS